VADLDLPKAMPCEVATLEFADMGISGPVSKEFLQSLDKAMTEVGFFYLGGVDAYCDLEEPINVARKFFALPVEEKFNYTMAAPDATPWFRGYQAVRAYPWHLRGSAPPPHSVEHVAKKRKIEEALAQPACESIDLGKHVPTGSYPNVRDGLSDFMEKYVYAENPEFPDYVSAACSNYSRKIDALGHRLMEVFALALGFDPAQELREHANQPWWYYRLINYRGGQKEPSMMPAHTDFGWLTILNQNFSTDNSLEMQDSDTKEWRPIPAKKGALIINIGDMMAKWTKGRYIPQVHRVIHKGENDRISVPFFFNPSIDAKVDDVCYGEHLMEKLAGYHQMAGYTNAGATTAQMAAGAPATKSTKEKDNASFTITFKGVDSDGRSDNSNTVCVKSV
jgi:isopenicillin N synthase-like dioxygenase